MAESTVKIGADISEIRRELAKLPNLSTEAAQKTLIQIEKAVQKAEKSAKRSAKAIKKSQRSTTKALDSEIKKLGEKAGDTDSILKALGGALGLISPEAEKALSGIGDLSGGVEAVTKSSTHLGLTLTSVTAMAAPFIVALGALAAAALLVANKADEASQELNAYRKVISDTDADTRSLAQSQAALKLATGDVSGFIGDLQIQTALLNGEIDNADLKAGDLGGTLADKLRPALLAAGKAVAENAARIDVLRDAQASASLGIEDLANANKELTEELAAQPELESNLANIKLLKEEGAAAINAYVQALTKKDEVETTNTTTVEKLTQAQRDQIAHLEEVAALWELITEGFESLEQAQALQADLDALAPDDLIDPATITRVRELIASVDKIVPPEGLAKIDQLRQVLFQLGAESDAAGGKNEELADAIRRVKGEIEDLEDSTPDPGDVLTFWEAFSIGAAAAASAVSTVSGAVSGLVGGFDRFLSLAGGFSLADLGAIAAEGGDVSGAVEELIQGGRDTVKVFVESLPAVIDAFVAELPGLIDDFISAIGPVVSAVGSAIPVVIDQIVEALPALVSTVADLITSGLFDQIIEKLPTVVSAILDELPTVITALLAAVGDVVAAIIFQIPAITLALIEAIPEILAAVVVALPDLAFAIVDAVLFELLPRMPEISIAITQALLADLPVALAEAFVDNVIGLLGRLDKGNQPQSTETFNDTPGPVRAGLSGLTARFAPGDTVIAAQDPAEALRQAQQASNGTTGGSQSVTLDLRDGHLAFDRMFRRNIRAGGSLGQLSNAAIGRVKVYG